MNNNDVEFEQQSIKLFEGIKMAEKIKKKVKQNGMPSPAPKRKKKK